jgi:hypothetical protein
VLQGRHCPLTERPIAALIHHASVGGRYAPCGAEFRIPSVIVEERLDAEPEPVGAVAHVGLDRGPDHVLKRMRDLLAA